MPAMRIHLHFLNETTTNRVQIWSPIHQNFIQNMGILPLKKKEATVDNLTLKTVPENE